MTPARILIADDHELLLRGLQLTVAKHPEWTICGEARDGREAVALALETKPDLVILDYAMPDMNGLEAARRIRSELPETEVLMFTLHETENLVNEALAAGVRGFVLKSDAGEMLEQAMESLLKKTPFFSSRISQVVLQQFLTPGEPAGTLSGTASRLSPREREVLQLIAEGSSTRDAALRLGISAKTAETHRTNIMRKLDLHSVADLVRFAIRNNIVEA